MYRRLLVITVAATLLLSFAGCTNKKVKNPIANVNSKQPDKVLFDRAMDAMKHNRFEVARMTLQTLINTYPDSEFVARAKLAVGDSWYAEGGSAALAQAENEYNDFITFFPNMPEAAEAQMKIAKIHYDQMEKPDRDFTHAKRAELAYREMIRQFPDSPLVPQAKERLREVQEVLAEREFLIGRFYYVRQSYPAAIARLKSLVDTYPLYSGADEALFMLGDSYEKEIEMIRQARGGDEARKGELIAEFTKQAADAYSRIITRYPVMKRASEAKQRLEALKRPVPVPTPQAIAENKAEEESRRHMSFRQSLMLTFHRSPDVSETARVGDPTMTDPKQASAPDFMRHAGDVLAGKEGGGSKSLKIEQAGTGVPAPNQPIPRSDSAVDPNAAPQQDNGVPELPITNQQPSPAASQQNAAPAAVPSQTSGDPAPPVPPSQANEIKKVSDTSSTAPQQSAADGQTASSSKKKKKSKLGKLIPF
jgi:outer membrane protein assembly factor BamD